MALSPGDLRDIEEYGDGPCCWICMYATDVGEDERVRTSPRVFMHVHAGEISAAYEDRAARLKANRHAVELAA